MTMQSEQLIGSRVIGGDGQVVGKIQQIFNDDVDGRPVWARIRAGMRERFVPLSGSRVTNEGISVPFSSQEIMNSPDIRAHRHMSAAQTDQLRRYFGLTVPAQGGERDLSGQTREAQWTEADRRPAQSGEPRPAEAGLGQAPSVEAQRSETSAFRTDVGQTRSYQTEATGTQAAAPAAGDVQSGEEWLIRAEERADISTEKLESGRVRVRKYVDVEQIEQGVRVIREDYEVERIPITPEERVSGVIAETVQEVILHEERPVLHKEVVPVERIRLRVKQVPEDRTVRDQLRKERIEVETDGGSGSRRPARPGQDDQPGL
jgi:stress response protein YsnF/sporulation protein YlmC with PRC-barrel domain